MNKKGNKKLKKKMSDSGYNWKNSTVDFEDGLLKTFKKVFND